MDIISPLRVPVNKAKSKFFVLNMNVFRNTHFHVLNKAKITYKELITPQLLQLPKFAKISLTYTLYPRTKHLCDLDNVMAVHAKFLQDALVENGIIEDDNYLYIIQSTYLFGSIDKERPRVDITIKEIK